MGLEKLYEEKLGEGLVVAGFPANEFGAQEPGSNQEIAEFCTAKFGVKFPMFEKIVVKGEGQHPLYRALIEAQPSAQEKPDAAADLLGPPIHPPPADPLAHPAREPAGSDFRAKLAAYGIKQGLTGGEVMPALCKSCWWRGHDAPLANGRGNHREGD